MCTPDLKQAEIARLKLIEEQKKTNTSPLQVIGSGLQLIKGQAPISILTGGTVSDGTLNSPEAQRALKIKK